MGFPIGYTEVFLPKLLIHVLTFLGLIRKVISVIFRYVGTGGFTEAEAVYKHFQSVSSVLIRELLPVVKYSEVEDEAESCAVCLNEFEGGDEVRQLMNCRHIFHRCCLDRWMDHSHKTCPLCRMAFVPHDLLDSFNHRLWVASGIGDYYYAHSSLITHSHSD